MGAKQAKLYAVVLEVYCPYCEEGLENAEGSFLWKRYEMNDEIVVACTNCNKYVRVKLPKRVKVR